MLSVSFCISSPLLVTPGNPQRCNLMIAKRSINCGFVYPESSCSGYHFSCEGSVKGKLASGQERL